MNHSFFIVPLETLKETQIFFPSERKEIYELFFVTGGYIVRECNLHQIRLNRNDFHVSLTGQITSILEFSDHLSGYYCGFESAFLEQLSIKDAIEKELAFVNSFIYRYPIRLTKIIAERLGWHFHTINLLYNENGKNALQLVCTYITVIISEIKKFMLDMNLNPYPSKMFLTTKYYHDLLVKYITQSRDLPFYAKMLNITPNHLNKSVKATTGKTAVLLLNEMMILESKMQLLHTNKTVGEIAFELGIEDQSYFTRFFKKMTGLTPLEYRKTK